MQVSKKMTIFLPGAFTKLLKDFWKIKMQFNFDDDFLRKERKSPKMFLQSKTT
jgi:hypothetical protein